MADLMLDLKNALADLTAKKKSFDAASAAVQNASGDYETSKAKVRKLHADVNVSLDEQLKSVGIDLADNRVHQSE